MYKICSIDLFNIYGIISFKTCIIIYGEVIIKLKALITGASSGIGRDIAIYLSELGYDIIAVGRNVNELKNLKDTIKTNTEIIAKDLSIKDNCYELYELVKSNEIEILVNNAGFGIFGNFSDTSLEKEIDLINTNIISLHILTKLFLKDMMKNNKGHILNVSSTASFIPGPLMAAYYSSKAYVTRLSQSIYKELKKKKSNVKISILCPGPVETNFNKTAGVNFSIKPLSSSYVARYAIDKMFKNKLVIVPGILNKVSVLVSRILPNELICEFVYTMQKEKLK